MPLYFQSALKQIARNLWERLDVPALATIAGVSPRTLYAAFNKHLGTTPAKYILAKRLEAVRFHLLTERPEVRKIGTTARAFGFVSASHFSREYFARFQETPTTTLRSN